MLVKKQPKLDESILSILSPHPGYHNIANKVPETSQILSVPKIQCHGENLGLAVRGEDPRVRASVRVYIVSIVYSLIVTYNLWQVFKIH